MLRKLAVIAIAAMFAGGLLLGCGGGDDQIDKAGFAEQANEACERASGRMAATVAAVTRRESQKPNVDFSAAQVATVNEALVPALMQELSEIRALGLPQDAEREARMLLDAYRRSIAKIEENPKSALTQGVPAYEPIELAGSTLGIDECPIAPVNAGGSPN